MKKMARVMVPLWHYAQALRAKGRKVNDEFYEDLASEFDLSCAEEARKDFYGPMREFVSKHCPEYLKSEG